MKQNSKENATSKRTTPWLGQYTALGAQIMCPN